MASMRNGAKRGQDHFWWIVGVVAVVYSGLHWNPAGYFMEAARPAYYQARIAFQRGGPSAQARVFDAFRDGKITQAEFSKDVFPAYLHVVQDGEQLFPDAERAKPVEQLRAELDAVVHGRTAGR